MAFDSARPDPEKLSRLPFGDAWHALVDPADLAACDVMDARVRLAMYRMLIERLNPHGVYGTRDELSPFWGYASQLAWQQRSGRLGGALHAIADGSWWGACNYALSVVPYAAAMHRGLVPELRFEVQPLFAPVMSAWHRAFDAMVARHADHDRVRVAVWRAHLLSITLAVKTYDASYRAMPAAERRFARGWVRMVDIFAAAGVRTDLDKLVETGGGALPTRMLREEDALEGLHRHEKSTVKRVGMLADEPRWRWGLAMRVWRRVMRTSRARGDAEKILAGVFGKGRQVWPVRARALAYATLPTRLVERV
jgi:hypothetical protein